LGRRIVRQKRKQMRRKSAELSSSGHKLGSLIGDWFERFFVLPLLSEVAAKLELFADNRFVERTGRRDKVIWEDEDGNAVDYDFVLELRGTKTQRGIPVAFVESFWRRGARHSKDKARDDSGKLMPMRQTYPTARFLGIVAAGDFTEPARELVRTRDIDLFYVPKDKIIRAFSENGIIMEYPDIASEPEKQAITSAFEASFNIDKGKAVAETLISLVGKAAVNSYVDRVRARLSALPQEIRFILRHESTPRVFRSLEEAADFLEQPDFQMDNPQSSYIYQVTYSDGTEFERDVSSIEGLKLLHGQIQLLAEHVSILQESGH
jgi:hypothetical protein